MAPALLGLVASVLVVGAATSPGKWFPGSRQGEWFFDFPVLGAASLSQWVALGVYFGAMTALGLAWMWLLRTVSRAGCSTAVVLVVFALWAAPFVVGPPTGSDDAVAYVAAGRLVDQGHDPYQEGMITLGESDSAVQASSPFWRETPQPYGPLYLRTVGLAAAVGGSSVRATVMVIRLGGLACLALMALPLSALARRYRRPPAVVLAAVLCSPLVVVHLVGGAHNEAFMLLLLLTGVAVGSAGLARPSGSRHRWPLVVGGVVLCGAAAAVKIPAIIGALVLGWLAAPAADRVRQVVTTAVAGLIAGATVLAIGAATGLGQGWIANLDVPRKANTIVAPFDAIGVVVMNGLAHLDRTVAPVDGFRTVGMLIGFALAAALVVRSDRIGLPLALGGALIALAVTSPVLWVWYLTWGFVFLALRGVPVWMQAAIVVLNLSVTPLGPGTLDVNNHPTISALFVVLVTAAVAVVAAYRWWEGREAGGVPAGPTRTARPLAGMRSATD